jgi:excisionase family DNA binding protein
MITEDEFMTPQNVADYLKVTIYAVYSWLGDGRLKGYKVGSDWRIRKSDVESFLKSNQAG